ncbi:MAG: lysophospholipid acyltransferase family protein [Deltaproteobacteria bacterium]|nr:lysophospholipid acyltransferase family protein [Deltaproteobacteria bacterium]
MTDYFQPPAARPGPALALFNILTRPLAWLPRPLGLALGAAGGRLAFSLLARRRRIALANMELVRDFLSPDFQAPETARSVFANHGRGLWEILCCYHRGLAPFRADCRPAEGAEYMVQALAESRRSGRGLMILTGHLGNWEIMCHRTAEQFGFKLHIVGRRTGRPLADTLAARLRTINGNRFLAKDGSAREMLAVLKSGGVLGTLIDQAILTDSPNSTILAPFMGRQATFNLGPLRLARRAGAAIILVVFRREGRTHFTHFFPSLPPAQDRPEEEDHLTKAGRINTWLGDYIRRYPDQWLWGHRRWKTKEDGAGQL